ncbi:MAG: hypothetical protein ACFHVJ_10620 [Aestuariibacter sp.]
MKSVLFAIVLTLSAVNPVFADDKSRSVKCQLLYEELLELHRDQFFGELSLLELLNVVEYMYPGEPHKDFIWCIGQLRQDILPSIHPDMVSLQPEQKI